MSIQTIKKLVLITLSITFLAIVAGVSFIFLHSIGVSQDIEVRIEPRHSEMTFGVPSTIDIVISNNTNKAINNVNVLATLGDSLVNAGDGEVRRIKKEIGVIGSGELVKEDIEVVPIDEGREVGDITVLASYSLGGVDFEARAQESLSIRGSAIEVDVDVPDQIMGSVPFEILVNYHNATDFDVANLSLQADYPQSFKFISSNPGPDSMNNVWSLGELSADAKGSVRITGELKSDQEASEIDLSFTTDVSDSFYAIQKKDIVLNTSEPPVSLDISRRGHPTAGNTLSYVIRYQNKSGIALKNNKINLDLTGVMIDEGSLRHTGNADISGTSLEWGFDDNPELELLEPTAQGSFEVVFDLEDEFKIERLSDKDFTVEIGAIFESPSVPYYLDAERTLVSANELTKIRGLARVEAQALFRDSESGIVNKGSLPPKVSEVTQYTVHWRVVNQSTDLRDVRITAELPDNVQWTGKTQSNVGSSPRYNAADRRVIWEIDTIGAATGILTPATEGVFQVEASPTETMVGGPQIILGTTVLEALDTFTDVKIADEDGPLSTLLRDDPTVETEDGIVVE